MAVDDEDIGPAIVVEVGQGAAPADFRQALLEEPCRGRDVLEAFAVEVAIQGIVFVPEMGHEQLGEAVTGHVLGVNAHARLGLARLRAGRSGDLARVLEGPVAPVEEQEVRAEVIGHEQVGPAIPIEVGRDDSHAPAIAAEDAGRLGPVLERAVPPIPEQEMTLGGDRQGRAIRPYLFLGIAAERVGTLVGPLAVGGDVQVEAAVTVVVEHRRPRGPERGTESGVRRGIAEGAVAVVQIQDVRSQVRQEQVGPSIVIDVADGQPMAEAPETDARPVSDVLERAVPRLR